MEGLIAAVIPVLMSRDIDTALAFYDKLGFRLAFKDDPGHPRYAAMARDGVTLHLQWQDPAHWVPGLDRPAYRFAARDVDGLYAELRAGGALPPTPEGPYGMPSDTPWGTREFHVRDPDGNCLQFFG